MTAASGAITSRLAGISLVYSLLPLGVLTILHAGLLPAGLPTFFALHVWFAVYTLMVVGYALIRQKLAPEDLRLTTKGLLPSLGVGLALAILIVPLFEQLRAFTPGRPSFAEAAVNYAPSALLAALMETVVLYGWLDRRLSGVLGFWTSAATTAALYAAYHVGYYGTTDPAQLDLFTLSLPLYFTTGLLTVLLARAAGNLLVLWPAYVTAGSVYDLARQSLYVPASSAPVLAGLTLATLLGMFLLAAARRGSRTVTAEPDPGIRAVLTLSCSAVRSALTRLDRGQWRLITWLVVLASFGLLVRYTINDPVNRSLLPYLPTDVAQRFMTDIPLFNELVIRLAEGLFFLVPLAAIAIAPKMKLVADDTCSAGWRHAATVALAVSAARTTVIATAAVGLVVVLASAALDRLPDLDQLTRLAVVVPAAGVYALFNVALTSMTYWAFRGTRWYWFASLAAYQFVFFWYAVYPLFSQYAAVPISSSPTPAAFRDLFATVSQRSQVLYAAVPYYSYYFLPTVGYLEAPFDPVYFIPSMAAFLRATGVATLAAMLYSLRSPDPTPGIRRRAVTAAR